MNLSETCLDCGSPLLGDGEIVALHCPNADYEAVIELKPVHSLGAPFSLSICYCGFGQAEDFDVELPF